MSEQRPALYQTLVYPENRNTDHGIPVSVYATSKQEAINRAIAIGWGGAARDARVYVKSVDDTPPIPADTPEVSS